MQRPIQQVQKHENKNGAESPHETQQVNPLEPRCSRTTQAHERWGILKTVGRESLAVRFSCRETTDSKRPYLAVSKSSSRHVP